MRTPVGIACAALSPALFERRFRARDRLVPRVFAASSADKRQQPDFAEDRPRPAGHDADFVVVAVNADAHMAEADRVKVGRRFTLAKQHLPGTDADERESAAQKFDDLRCTALARYPLNNSDACSTRSSERSRYAASKLRAAARQAHQAIEHVAPDLPDFGIFEHRDVGVARRAAQARHLTGRSYPQA